MLDKIRKYLNGYLETEVCKISAKEKINYGYLIDLSRQLEKLEDRIEKLEKSTVKKVIKKRIVRIEGKTLV